MRDGSGARSRGRIAAYFLTAALLAALPAGAARAHDGGKLRGTCSVSNISGRATVTVKVDNLWDGSVFNLTHAGLAGSSTGSATLFAQTSPRAVRELLPNKSAQFIWKGRFYGDGYIDLTAEIGGEFDDDHSETTGLINCNRIAVGNPDGNPPTPTARNTDVPVPATDTPEIDTPIPASATAGRPTRTPNVPRPTRTPRLDPTNTMKPPATATQPRPTRTPIAPRPTRTPIQQETRQPTQPRPTRTPVVHQVPPTNPPRPTRTPVVHPTDPPTRIPTSARATNTPTRIPPTRTFQPATRTPIPQRPTRTPQRPPTPRPTRTPNIQQPTATQPAPNTNGGLYASCSLRRTEDFVVVTMLIENRSGVELSDIGVGPLELDAQNGALIFDRSGPSPDRVSVLRAGDSTTIQWGGRLSPGGTMGFRAYATASSPSGPLRTPLTDCGVTGVQAGTFDPSAFNGDCSISPGENGEITVQVRNASRETLTDVEAAFISRSNTGNAGAFELRGPAPRTVASMAAGSRREFTFGARFLGEGQITMRFVARGTRVTHHRVETQVFECTAELGGGSGGSLPDLGVDSDALRQSLQVSTENFPADSCAIAEGCVDGSGNRKLLRFSTVTPNYGPGDVFLGDPLDNPEFVYSSCHNHFHFEQYADYRLLDMSGNVVARGHKQAFCLVDLWPVPGLGGDPHAQFPTCEFQGISAGWADIYHRGLDCQWVDITAVPSGRYVLEVEINPGRVITEHNYSNNVGRAEVTVP